LQENKVSYLMLCVTTIVLVFMCILFTVCTFCLPRLGKAICDELSTYDFLTAVCFGG